MGVNLLRSDDIELINPLSPVPIVLNVGNGFEHFFVAFLAQNLTCLIKGAGPPSSLTTSFFYGFYPYQKNIFHSFLT